MSEAKKRKIMKDVNTNIGRVGSPFELLDDDSLRAILLRTQATDHPNLRLSCKRFDHILNSVDFRKERSYLGYAEVKVELLDSFDQYKRYHKEMMNDGVYGDERDRQPPSRLDDEFLKEFDQLGKKDEYGSHEFDAQDFRIFVDGVPLHKNRRSRERQNSEFRLTLQRLSRRGSFYELCDVYSDELVRMGTSLFTNHGRPKANSIKKALQDNDNNRPILYISTFELPFEYRSTSSTVGPLILQEILKVFKEEYSLAIYIPWYEPQYSLEEYNKYRYAEKVRSGELTEQHVLEEAKQGEHFRKLTHQDIRQFFRAGFQQVHDSKIMEGKTYYLFVTRSDARESLLTAEEALELQITSPPPPPPPRTGLTLELWKLMKKKCSFYNREMNGPIKSLRGDMNVNQALLPFLREQGLYLTEKQVADSRSEKMQLLKDRMRRELLDGLNAERRQKLTEAEAELDDYIEKGFDEIKTILDECTTSEERFRLILNSHSVHACAANGCLPLLNKILGYLPEPAQQSKVVLNHPDDVGFTPIMIVAEMASRKKSTHEIEESIELIEALITLGADKNFVHAYSGRSALGTFREGLQSKMSFNAAYGYLRPEEVLPDVAKDRMESVLMPEDGPTEADEDAFEMNDGNSDSPEDGFHDDDEDIFGDDGDY